MKSCSSVAKFLWDYIDFTCIYRERKCVDTIGTVPIQLVQCWYSWLAISNAKILIYFSNKICASNFIKQHLETVMV